MIEVYRGSPNTWECDEMGHMNVRFYAAKMMEGIGAFAAYAGMPHAFLTNAYSTLRPSDNHIRFIREAHAAHPFYMTAGVLDVTDSSVKVYLELRHGDGRPCATYQVWLDHIDTITETPFPWSPKARAAFEDIKTDFDPKLGPRSVSMETVPAASATMEDADKIGAPIIGRGLILPDQCDALGWMKPEFFLGRVSDSVPNLLHDWRQSISRETLDQTDSDETTPMGAAVLEYRLIYRKWPRAGDLFVMRSAIGQQSGKTHGLFHWMLDPKTGDAWMTSQVAAINFDLETRKAIEPPTPMKDAFKKIAPAGLWL